MKIIQPPDTSVNTPNGALKFKWNKSFGAVMTARLQEAQKHIDQTCIDQMIPYTPWRNGFLEESVKIGTVIGSGKLRYLSPYARYLYYGEIYGPSIPIFEKGNPEPIGFFSPKRQRKHATGRPLTYTLSNGHQLAGKLWFERMKADHKGEILEGAAKIAGGVAK